MLADACWRVPAFFMLQCAAMYFPYSDATYCDADFCQRCRLFDYYRLINQKKGIAQCYSDYFSYFCKVEITKHT